MNVKQTLAKLFRRSHLFGFDSFVSSASFLLSFSISLFILSVYFFLPYIQQTLLYLFICLSFLLWHTSSLQIWSIGTHAHAFNIPRMFELNRFPILDMQSCFSELSLIHLITVSTVDIGRHKKSSNCDVILPLICIPKNENNSIKLFQNIFRTANYRWRSHTSKTIK